PVEQQRNPGCRISLSLNRATKSLVITLYIGELLSRSIEEFMTQLLDATAKGMYAISATPFTDTGEIDWASMESLIEFYVQCGVNGLTILGMMGEAQKLSEDESAEFTRRYIRRVEGRVPVIVGVSNAGTANLVKLSK